MFTILKSLYASAVGVFSRDPQVRKNASMAFAAVLLMLICAVLTAWLAQPGYEAIIVAKGSREHITLASWAVAGMVGFVMFIISGYIAAYIIEVWIYGNTEIPGAVAGIALTVWLLIGAGDAFVSWQGASIRAHEGTALSTTPEASATSLPYADRLDGIDRDMAQLQHVYAWCGKHKTRHPLEADNTYACASQRVHFASTKYTKSRYPADKAEMDRLTAQKAEYEALQQQAVATSQLAVNDANTLATIQRDTASFSLHGLSIGVYLIQLLAGGMVAFFMLLSDDPDTARKLRESRLANEQKTPASAQMAGPAYAGFQVGQHTKGEHHPIKMIGFHEMLNAQSREGNTTHKDGEESPGELPKPEGEIVHTHQREIRLNNAHPKFTKRVQPDVYRGIDEKKYKRFVKAAKKVCEQRGKYVATAIAKESGIDRRTVATYLKLAIEERGDLKS